MPSTWTLFLCPCPAPGSADTKGLGEPKALLASGCRSLTTWGQELHGGDVPPQADMLLVFEASPAHHPPTGIPPYNGAFHWHEVSRTGELTESGKWWLAGVGEEMRAWEVTAWWGQFQFCVKEGVVKTDVGDSCTTMWMHLTRLNCTLKNHQDDKFYFMYILPQ